VFAPGDEYVRLVSARVLDRRGATVTSVPIDEPVGIEVVYDILKARENIQPALHFRTQRGDYAFVVAYTDPAYMRAIPRAGRYTATAWVPGNVLNAGVLYVSIVMATPDPLERHCTAENALSFNVYERLDGGNRSARGLYGKEFPGPVRPLLTWETRRLSEHDSARAKDGAATTHVTTTS
jgi:lipopolysaccharide transport system ATP-binding protein